MNHETANGLVVYDGPSHLDRAPIIVVLTGLNTRSTNSKTGDMVQSYIIRADVDPMTAARTGQDVSICGECEHRPTLAAALNKPPCYVNKAHGPAAVFRGFLRGIYPTATPQQAAARLAGRVLRLGTYGDPAAAPAQMWQTLTDAAAGHTGYSHQWQRPGFDFDQWRGLVMASADNLDQAARANLHGMRVFRVTTAADRQPGEVICPASAEAGKRTTCAECRLCAGTSKAARDVVIQDHAPGHKARRVIPLIAA